jgi:hypothetical protein
MIQRLGVMSRRESGLLTGRWTGLLSQFLTVSRSDHASRHASFAALPMTRRGKTPEKR